MITTVHVYSKNNECLKLDEKIMCVLNSCCLFLEIGRQEGKISQIPLDIWSMFGKGKLEQQQSFDPNQFLVKPIENLITENL